jgi:hypothetical protein
MTLLMAVDGSVGQNKFFRAEAVGRVFSSEDWGLVARYGRALSVSLSEVRMKFLLTFVFGHEQYFYPCYCSWDE